MNINGISDNVFTLNPLNEKTGTGQNADFKNVFSDLLGQAVQLDAAGKAENINLMTGDSDNTHDAMIAAEKADISLLLAVQIRNKIIDAYSEIMRMQI